MIILKTIKIISWSIHFKDLEIIPVLNLILNLQALLKCLMQYIWDDNVANSPRAKLETSGFLQFVIGRTVLPPNNGKPDKF